MKRIFFTPGPSQLYPTVKKHIAQALKEDIPSISHRGSVYQELSKKLKDGLRRLLDIPETHKIYFLSSGTEAMERVIENVVQTSSLHFVNGAFAERFFKAAEELKKKPQKYEVPLGEGFHFNFRHSGKRTERAHPESLDVGDAGQARLAKASAERASMTGFDISAIPSDTELLCFTQNETSTGVAIPMEDIYQIKKQHPEKLIALDIVSSAPYVTIDFSKIDITFFSVQKGFGLPAGLGVIIVSPQAFEKTKLLSEKGLNIGSYHNFLSLEQSSLKEQTPETPNVLDMYLLQKVVEDMLVVGIEKIRKETEEKASILYDFFEKTKNKPFVKDTRFRSQTVILVQTLDGSKVVIEKLKEKGFIVGSGYGELKDTQIRIANFPAITKKDVESLLEIF
ncbi:MAG: alanine--glyoxylate aminotransferase family protein [Candidatus Levybacteria bacterium]|nr:alanine--glyoxylate aminotransferase family protein [Candidatus Levybacteria bacterium]